MNLNIPGVSITSTPRKDGRFQGYVVIKGEKFYVYGRTRQDVEDKIRFYLRNGTPRRRKAPTVIDGIPQTFGAFTLYFFEKFRKKKVTPATYVNDLNRFRNHIKPTFNEKPLKKITPGDCQDVIDKLIEEGKGKTADEVYSLLSVILKGAISHGIITKNPLGIVYKPTHERKHGTALNSEEIERLKSELKNSPLMQPFMILLYTGLRPNELSSVKIEGPFVVAVNSKRKNKKTVFKKIPITPMLLPYLSDNLYFSSPDYLRRKFKEILPDHILYDLRTTFYSRCKECGVSEPALNHFVGHSSGVLADAYTNLSDEYLLSEGQKIRF